MNPSKTLVFFGNERLSTGFSAEGAPTLTALLKAGYHIAAVVANFQTGHSRTARTLEVEEVAKQYNIPVFLPSKPSEIKQELTALNADAGVLVAYGRIIPQSIIELFPHGILNIHPSLLPLYRGSTPIEQVMLDGVQQTGISIMKLVKEMDAGPIFAQKAITLTESETKQALTKRLLHLGGEMLLEVLPDVLSGKLTPSSQDESAATYTTLINKATGMIDWHKPAERLKREVRAYASWPKSRTALFDKDIVVTETRVANDHLDGDLVIECGQKTWLEITKLIAPSGRTVTGADFIRGYKKTS